MRRTRKSAQKAALDVASPLLAADEPPPFAVYNEGGAAPLVLLCDHASRFIPRALAGLGLGEAELARHIAWDIGVAEVARGLARRLDAPAVLSQFCRLIVDPNRSLVDPTLIPQLSDGVIVPGNRHVSPAAAAARIATFHAPYHAAVARQIAALRRRHGTGAIVSMHSFTPVMKGIERPWQIGILWGDDPRLPLPLMKALRARGIVVGDNEPYSGREGHGHTLHEHAAPSGLPNVLIEVRQDLIDTHHGAAQWVEVLGEVLAGALASLGLRDGVISP